MTVFVISDLHIAHKGILSFDHRDGTPLRINPETGNRFESIWEMAELIHRYWSETVRPSDKVYVLGDICMSKSKTWQAWFRSLPGKKRLVMGNHDLNPTQWYLDAGFQALYGVRQIEGIWLTHVPMHQQSVNQPRVRGNVHGHLHRDFVWNIKPSGRKGAFTHGWKNSNYFNACVENVDYRPMSLETICLEMEW